ncbi:hypothetical protein VSR01_09630 [Actinacidiphila sp. DG2A-62]|uniref:hypothetical protein n=1 Tax=Actinacidiphila sp. DG2A-62 TaxID=3108821 RepID=UPI002DB803C7|nr:hypothetical protein [Actinacidiphila sp. DG2A-62]MEC3993786.1 hypothetical protein [Actinacidiphila sp. DG2A-62]
MLELPTEPGKVFRADPGPCRLREPTVQSVVHIVDGLLPVARELLRAGGCPVGGQPCALVGHVDVVLELLTEPGEVLLVEYVLRQPLRDGLGVDDLVQLPRGLRDLPGRVRKQSDPLGQVLAQRRDLCVDRPPLRGLVVGELFVGAVDDRADLREGVGAQVGQRRRYEAVLAGTRLAVVGVVGRVLVVVCLIVVATGQALRLLEVPPSEQVALPYLLDGVGEILFHADQFGMA